MNRKVIFEVEVSSHTTTELLDMYNWFCCAIEQRGGKYLNSFKPTRFSIETCEGKNNAHK